MYVKCSLSFLNIFLSYVESVHYVNVLLFKLSPYKRLRTHKTSSHTVYVSFQCLRVVHVRTEPSAK